MSILGGSGQAHTVLARMDLVLQQSMVCCQHLDLHSIGTMMGFHAVKLWQNEMFYFLYHMNIIIETHFNSQMGKMESNNTSERA
jgi:hypothetical protein